MTLCKNCIYLWKRCNKFYCTHSSIENVSYSKTKKECKAFKEGNNVRNYYSKMSKKYKV